MKDKEIKKASDLPNFPYSSFEEFRNAVNKGEVEIGVAMDISRQWLTSNGKYAPRGEQIKAYIYMLTPYIFAIFLLIYSVLNLKFHYLLLFIPFIISLFTLTPVGLRVFGIMNFIIGAGIVLFFYSVFSEGSSGLLLLSLTVIVPWLSHRFLYKLASRVARENTLKHEDLFIAFTRARAVSARYPTTGERLWFDKDWDKDKEHLKQLESRK